MKTNFGRDFEARSGWNADFWVCCAFGNVLPSKELRAFTLLHRWEVRSSWWLMMVEIDVNNCEKEEALIMKVVQLIAAKNDTGIKSTRHEKTLKGFVRQRFNWSQNMREKKSKKCHQPGKSTSCPAFFSYNCYKIWTLGRGLVLFWPFSCYHIRLSFN